MPTYFIYSLGTAFLWGTFLLDAWKPGSFGILFALLYSFYSPYVVKDFIDRETTPRLIVKYLFPISYLLFSVGLFIYRGQGVMVIALSPLLWASALMGIALIHKEQFPKKHVQFFTITAAIVYSFSLHNYYRKFSNANTPHYDFSLPDATPTPTPATPLAQAPNSTLADFLFINQKLDTVQLPSEGQYTIIETWNERCPPCMKAIPALKGFYAELGDRAQQRYVYVPPSRRPVDTKQVFDFPLIGNPQRILMNVNLQQDLQLDSYPVFLVFDPKGELVLLEKGFGVSQAEQLKDKIRQVILRS